jgi:lysophospholipase L1-like esterase
LQRVEIHVLPLHPHIVILQVGVNDFRELLLAPTQARAIISRCRENIGQIVKKLRKAHTHLVLSTIFPVADVTPQQNHDFWGMRRSRAADQVGQAVMMVNTSLRLLDAPDVTLFDAHRLLCNGDGFLQERYAADALHVNELGYSALNAKLSTLLQQRTPVAGA